MTPHQKRKLERLATALDEAQRLIRELLHEPINDLEQKHTTEFDTVAVLASLKHIDREVAEQQLSALKHYELGAIFVEAGGPSSDKKKPKSWLVNQILWRIFDFERGHEAIRGKGAAES